jgi:hypothetical protein
MKWTDMGVLNLDIYVPPGNFRRLAETPRLTEIIRYRNSHRRSIHQKSPLPSLGPHGGKINFLTFKKSPS